MGRDAKASESQRVESQGGLQEPWERLQYLPVIHSG